MNKPTLIPDWRESWTYYSQIANAVICGMSSIALAFGENTTTLKVVLACNIVVATLGAVGRVVEQTRRIASEQ